jgi:hypothetical protein
MDIVKFFKSDIVTGIVIGAVVGLYYPLADHKTLLLLILGVVMVLRLKLVSLK